MRRNAKCGEIKKCKDCIGINEFLCALIRYNNKDIRTFRDVTALPVSNVNKKVFDCEIKDDINAHLIWDIEILDRTPGEIIMMGQNHN